MNCEIGSSGDRQYGRIYHFDKQSCFSFSGNFRGIKCASKLGICRALWKNLGLYDFKLMINMKFDGLHYH